MSGRHGKMSGSPFHIEYLYKNHYKEHFEKRIVCKYLNGFICTLDLNSCYKKRCLPFKCKYLHSELRRKNKCTDCAYYKAKRTCFLLKNNGIPLNLAEYCDHFVSKESNSQLCEAVENAIKYEKDGKPYSKTFDLYIEKIKTIKHFYKVFSHCNNKNKGKYVNKIYNELNSLELIKEKLSKSKYHKNILLENDKELEMIKIEIKRKRHKRQI